MGRQELGAHEFSSEILGNKAAKLLHTPVILESPLLFSATEALKLLNWTPLQIRRQTSFYFLY